jgi:hypothetical protein
MTRKMPGGDAELTRRNRVAGQQDQLPPRAATATASMAVISTDASRVAGQLGNALEAARGIRDRAEAAIGRGLRDDDATEIRRLHRFLETSLADASRALDELAKEAGRL